ncbi:hypothetical protein D3C73_1249570 [compost metagenome]
MIRIIRFFIIEFGEAIRDEVPMRRRCLHTIYAYSIEWIRPTKHIRDCSPVVFRLLITIKRVSRSINGIPAGSVFFLRHDESSLTILSPEKHLKLSLTVTEVVSKRL